MKPETIVEGYLCKRAEQLGFLHYKFRSPGTNGVPDQIIIGYGKTVFIETKAKGKTPRKKQQLEIDKINDHGGTALVADTREQVDEILSSLMETPKKRRAKTST